MRARALLLTILALAAAACSSAAGSPVDGPLQRFLLQSEVTRTVRYGECVLFEMQRTPLRTVLASCHDRTPIEVASSSTGRWHLYPDGLRRYSKTTIGDGEPVLAVELIAMGDISRVARTQPPFTDGAAPSAPPPGGWHVIREPEIRFTATDRFGNTPLHSAARRNDLGLIEALLDAGMAVDVTNNAARTPLMEATAFNRLDAVRLLVARGARAAK